MVARTAFPQLHLVCQLCPVLVWEALPPAAPTLVISRMDWREEVYEGPPLESTQKPQLVQNGMPQHSLVSRGT